MTDRELVSLREYLEQRLDYERSLVAQRFEMLEKALTLQAAEYERRLIVLNHAHEAAVKEQARVLPRELFDQFKDDYADWRDSVNTSLTTIATRSAIWTAIVGVLVILADIAVNVWRR